MILNKASENIVNAGGYDISFFYDQVSHTPVLNIWFPGAYNRAKGVTQFQRHTWIKNFEGSFIIFDDPTIEDGNDLSIGWFQGLQGELIAVLVGVIREIISELNFREENVRLFGSSAGGFVALKLSELLSEPDVLVINPQTNILNYSKKHVGNMLEYSYSKSNDMLTADEKNKLKHAPDLNRKGKIFYFQNKADKLHLKNHYGPVLSFLKLHQEKYDLLDYSKSPSISDKKYNFYLYTDSVLKHSPPDVNGTLDFFKIVGW